MGLGAIMRVDFDPDRALLTYICLLAYVLRIASKMAYKTA